MSKKPKILVLGESFTFGWLIEDENTFIHKMQNDNPNFNLINVSSGAWGSSHYSLFIDLYCNKIRPKKIFIFLNTDDFDRGFKSGFYKNYKNDLIKNKIEFADIQQESKFDRNIPFYKFLKKNSHLFMFTRNIVYNLIYEPEPYYNEWSTERYWPRPIGEFDQEYSRKVNEFNKKIFLKIQKLSNNCGATLHLFNLMWSNHKKMKDSNPNKLFLKLAKSFFDKNNFSYFENESGMLELYKNPMKYIIGIDYHPNENGANLIYTNLKDEVNKILSR